MDLLLSRTLTATEASTTTLATAAALTTIPEVAFPVTQVRAAARGNPTEASWTMPLSLQAANHSSVGSEYFPGNAAELH
jgi:hypothetical protein